MYADELVAGHRGRLRAGDVEHSLEVRAHPSGRGRSIGGPVRHEVERRGRGVQPPLPGMWWPAVRPQTTGTAPQSKIDSTASGGGHTHRGASSRPFAFSMKDSAPLPEPRAS